MQYYSLNEAAATSICQRLPSYFVFALNQEWHTRPSDYESINRFFNTPVSGAAEREKSWQLYNAWLRKQIDEPMFAEAFGLRQVYIKPRAYYEQEIENSDKEEFDYGRGVGSRPKITSAFSNLKQGKQGRLREQGKRRNLEINNGRLLDKEYQKIVVDLASNLRTWINKADSRDAIRIISGDPGSGKSSFSKMLAAKLSETENIRILFIPLHLFDPTGDLLDSVFKFIRYDKYLFHNPLDLEQEDTNLLIIFDGLDELSMQGKLGVEVAKSFIGEVQKTVNLFNRQEKRARLQVIISGRPVIISSNRDELRKPEQILHLLPYVIDRDNRRHYQDQENFLQDDQRNSWWENYGLVTGKNYTAMPEELKLDSLVEITSQPLLNYLVALSYVRSKDDAIEDKDKIIFSEEINLNAIYQDLLKSVHKRGWDTDQHPTLKGVEYKNFVRILEEIAIAAWHGDGRTTTVKEIEAHCESSGLKRLLEIFAEGAKSGVTSLLTAFYFRQSGYGRDGDRTFEFTHKSFGEYLTARRIIRELSKINKELRNRESDPDEGWDEKQALTRWIIICGMSAIDEYLFKFICNEIALYNIKTVKQWQETLDNLISFTLRQGMPMERINPRPDYQEECYQGRNAEEALLVVVNACARYTRDRSKISFEFKKDLCKWLCRLQNHPIYDDNTIVNLCLNWLNLERAYLERANLKRAHLERANLVGANLVGANLEGINLKEANLEGINLKEVNLKRADLRGSNLKGVNLKRADLRGANLQQTDLVGADLRGANLQQTDLQGANFEGAYLQQTDLVGANLRGAYLEGADLKGANLKGANLEGAILDDKVRRQIESFSKDKRR